MQQVNDVIVVSDIHLARRKGGAKEKGQELFQADSVLAQLLTWIHHEIKDCLVILNGDIFDYLAISPNQEAKEAVTGFLELPARTTAIIEDHPDVFDALARLAGSPGHEVVITGGNHDPELIFPAVQRMVEKRLSNSSKLIPLRWCVQGEALSFRVGHARTLIEHGDVLDAWNRIDRSALRSAVSLASRGLLAHHRYQPPPGSRMVLDFLISLKCDYPWVELLKPETSTVPHLLRYYLPKAQLPEFTEALFHYIHAAKTHVIVKLCETLEPQQLFMATSGALGDEENDSALTYFQRLWNELSSQGTAFRKRNLISRLRQTARKNSFFDVAKADAGTYKPLSFLVRSGADLLIHGHTHSAKAYKIAATTPYGQRDGLYVNSGTWARMLKLPNHDESDDRWQQFVDGLREGKAAGFERLTFARAGFDGKHTVARLQEWKAGAPIDLAVHTFVPDHETWTRES